MCTAESKNQENTLGIAPNKTSLWMSLGKGKLKPQEQQQDRQTDRQTPWSMVRLTTSLGAVGQLVE